MNQITEILEQRESRYGSFITHASITQRIKEQMKDSPNWKSLPNDMKEALEMTAHKIGRILNGDPYYADSWMDICGYNQLIVNVLENSTVCEDSESEIERKNKLYRDSKKWK